MRMLTINLVIALGITTLFAAVLAAQAGNRVVAAARPQLEMAYSVTVDPYLPIQMVEPAF